MGGRDKEEGGALKGTHREGAAPPSLHCPTPAPPGAATHRSGSADADTTACCMCVLVLRERRRHEGSVCVTEVTWRTYRWLRRRLPVGGALHELQAGTERGDIRVCQRGRDADVRQAAHLHGHQPAGQALLHGHVARLLLRHGWECSPVSRLLCEPPAT